MKCKLSKIIIPVLSCLVLTLIFTTTYLAAMYIYYSGGLLNPEVKVKDSLSYMIFNECIAEWNKTNTPVRITRAYGSGDSYVTTGRWNDSWYGMYTPRSRQYVLWGRAKKFKIELNRNTLDNKSYNFRRSVLVHEFGHAFCLNDNPSSGNLSIMNYDRNRNYLTWPAAHDVLGVTAAYLD